MKTLALTSPYTMNADVKAAQSALRGNVFNQDYLRDTVDGVFGENTARACVRAKYWLGYPLEEQQPFYGTATPDTVLTAPAFTADGSSTYRIEFYSPEIRSPASAGDNLAVYLYLDGSAVGVLAILTNETTNAQKVPMMAVRYLVPASGSRTYSVRAAVSAGTGYVFGGDGATTNHSPAVLRVTSV
jgi:hypothetical protein